MIREVTDLALTAVVAVVATIAGVFVFALVLAVPATVLVAALWGALAACAWFAGEIGPRDAIDTGVALAAIGALLLAWGSWVTRKSRE